MLRRLIFLLLMVIMITMPEMSATKAETEPSLNNVDYGNIVGNESSPLPEATLASASPAPSETADAGLDTPMATPAPTPEPTEKPNIEPIKVCISFAGDCTLGSDTSFGYTNSFTERLAKEKNNYSYFFDKVKSVFREDDLTLVNLETTLTDAEKPAVKKFRFKGKPAYVNILKEGFVEAVNIANNHIRDYLDRGFSETIKTLDDAGIKYTGWNNTAYFDVKGITIGLLGFTGWDMNMEESLKAALTKASNKADIVIVSFHWGTERSYYPDKGQIRLAHFCIDNGANIVIGHHPHVLQGIEEYKKGYIAYSLGNFCFGGNKNPKDKDTMIFQGIFTLLDGKLLKTEAAVIPCSISSVSGYNNYQPVILEGKEKDRVLKKIEKLSRFKNSAR